MVSESISTATTNTDSVPFMKTKASAAVPDYSPISPAALKGIQTLTNNGGNNVINIYNIEQPAAAASAAAILAANGIHTFQPIILGGGIGTVKFAAPPTETTTLTAPATLPHKKCDERLSGTGADYRGCQDHTISGTLCQAWDLQHPHVHVRNTPETNPEDGLDGNNYCRNPGNSHTEMWRYTSLLEKVWEACLPLR